MGSRERGSTRQWPLPTAIVAVLLGAWAVIFWMAGRRPAALPTSAPAQQLAAEKHYVTPQQLVACGAMSARSLGPLTLVGHDGRRREWSALAAARPVVVVFIKAGCPCSVEFEPFFHRLARAYRGSVCFAGVIDAPVETARQYAESNHVPYLVLADPGKDLISRFGATNGAYVALVTPAGTIDTLWPGCSAEMMLEMSRRIADLAGIEEQRVETSGLPGVLTTGCPFAD
jgi:peroxiredoxin